MGNQGIIYCGDNLEVLPKYLPDESVDLCYIDPPFNTSRNYEVFWGEAQERRAFEDRFGDVTTYMEWMRPRIRELHRVLKPTGSFYYHCDWHASHYIKLELDRVFGFDNFKNEIIWKRTSAHSDTRSGFSRVTDSIFFYTKSAKAVWNPLYQPHSVSYIRSHYSRVNAENRPYRLDNIIRSQSMGPRPNLVYEYKGFTPPHGWRVIREKLEAIDRAGRLHWTAKGKPYLVRILDEQKGEILDNLWTDIPPVNSQAKERLGYPTQKPLALLDRILEASSTQGDTILDAFCGCGTTLEAAARMNRQFIGIDFSPTACRVMSERLERLGMNEGVDFYLRDMPKTPEQLRRIPHGEFENWAVIALGGIPNKVKVGDYGIDGRLYLADIEKQHRGDFMETLDLWYPIQVKQMDHVGRPDIDRFETAMRRDKRLRGYFVAFGYTTGAMTEIRRAQNDGLDIRPITVGEILEHERVAVAV